jgi:hypothetical protein
LVEARVDMTWNVLTVALLQVLQDDNYLLSAKRLSAVLQVQARQRHPYAAAADEVEMAIRMRLLRDQNGEM